MERDGLGRVGSTNLEISFHSSRATPEIIKPEFLIEWKAPLIYLQRIDYRAERKPSLSVTELAHLISQLQRRFWFVLLERGAGHIISNENKRCFIYCIFVFLSQDAEGFNAVHHVHSIVLELQAKHEKLVQTTAELVNEYNRREKSLEELCSSIDRLEQNKADKKHVSQEIGIKVRKFMDRHVSLYC